MIVGGVFNVFIMFPNVSMTFPIAFISIMGLYSHSHGVCFKVFIIIRPYLFDLMLCGPDRLTFLKFQLIMKIMCMY